MSRHLIMWRENSMSMMRVRVETTWGCDKETLPISGTATAKTDDFYWLEAFGIEKEWLRCQTYSLYNKTMMPNLACIL